MINNNKLNIATLNINGMRFSAKQSDLLQVFNSYNFSILFLQETHVDTISLGNAVKNKFNCKAFWSFGSNQSNGVGILLSSSLNCKYQKFETDLDGRLLS